MKPLSIPAVEIGPAALSGFDAILDVRSPAEFADDHVPGAESVPVLDNEERARVGTIYKQHSPFDAKKIGAALVARNIARHIESGFIARPRGWRPLIYCWRGGKRSGAMAHILREIGWDAHTLLGGYRAYRRYVVERLGTLPGMLRFRVVHGVTGSGKSRLLQSLRGAGAQVLDLEDLAVHRGSVLGNLPDQAQPSQKMFDSRLLAALQRLDAATPVFVEGESRKIGQVQLPEALITRMRASECILLDAAPHTRVALLLDEYRHFFQNLPALNGQLDCLASLHGHERVAQWKALAAGGEWAALVSRLLAEHYDPAYQRSAASNFPLLGQAPRVAIDSAAQAAFDGAARMLHRGAKTAVAA